MGKYATASIYGEDERPGAVLANLACPNREKDTIMVVQADDSSEITDPEHIANRFCEYYEALYTSKIAPNREALLEYLLHIEFLRLTAADRESLIAPLSLEEMSRAMGDMVEGKAPGPDGLTVRFYKAFKDILFPHLRAVYAEMAILADWLAILLPNSIKPEQSGFIPGCSLTVNLCTGFGAIQNVNPETKAVADEAKAFDSVEWHFLMAVLQRLGVWDVYLQLETKL
ncbi:hypothetical protein NDU88_008167 [Pleurodeles waltl]|uniref:Uncharacterized protein n=1 Tax=Pleurodeles waltl TaxID=8319 RepID=A0AAV7VU99_PLEWA|nr:hypothetical protein NDU88_008167 [Pleurodeles waltl]